MSSHAAPKQTRRPPIAIVPSSGLYLKPYEGLMDRPTFDLDRQEQRFAGIFRHTWKALPQKDRQTMRTYWRTDPNRWMSGFAVRSQHVSPGVRLMDPQDMPEFQASCKAGHSLWFCFPILIRCSDRDIAATIAHELAHVYLYATGWEMKKTHRELQRGNQLMARREEFTVQGLQEEFKRLCE